MQLTSFNTQVTFLNDLNRTQDEKFIVWGSVSLLRILLSSLSNAPSVSAIYPRCS